VEGVKASELFARFSPASSAEEGRAFFQRRLALFTKTMFFAFVALLVFVNALYATYPETRPVHAYIVNYVAAGGLCFQVWFWSMANRTQVLDGRFLMGLDAASITAIAAALTLSGTLSDGRAANVYVSFMWMSYTVFARSLIVPSTARRTAVLSTVCIGPSVLASFAVEMEVPTEVLLLGTSMLSLVVVVLATIGSYVIYGLRAQVIEAAQLGQYTLLEKIGEGGMGAVYRARHAMLRRPTAIKLLRPELAGKDSLARFEREVQATSELTHPNTVAVFDYGRSPEGSFYYAMEFLDGVDLETLVATSGPQPWKRVVHILCQICGALEEAHSRGMVHRDIKPGNVLLCNRVGIRDMAKVVDFGLVREIASADRLTKADVVAGTPAYLSPEAVTDPHRVGPASDLYAVGAVGYFLLTGEVVFSGSTALEVCVHHVRTPPVPPSQRTDNDVPGGLEQLLLQCLAKEPDDRPRSARELRLALSRLGRANRWTERQAYDWWDEFDSQHGAELSRARPGAVGTVTIDMSNRTAELAGLLE